MIAMLTRKLFDKLRRKSYREAYVEENVRTGIAYQIRALREARGWSQKKFAELLSKPQSVLSRIEDPDYGKLSLQTLLEVASTFDVALLVQFAEFPEFVDRMANVSPEALNKASFSESQFIVADTTRAWGTVSGASSGAMTVRVVSFQGGGGTLISSAPIETNVFPFPPENVGGAQWSGSTRWTVH